MIKGHKLDSEEWIEIAPSDDSPLSALGVQDHDRPLCRKTDLYPHLQWNACQKGRSLINTTKDKDERISRLLEMHANQRKDRDEFFTGDIAAVHRLEIHEHGRHALLRRRLLFSLKR